jgi:catechol 2,3-dioxygenase-like lactoylglutathione lyase family enzyme
MTGPHPEHHKEFRQGIAHITIVVNNLPQAIANYEKILGMRVSSYRTGRGDWDVASFRSYGTRIELVHPNNDNNPIARHTGTDVFDPASLEAATGLPRRVLPRPPHARTARP